ncbi:hypothetical protein A2789_02300 [Candidatus Peribacteria bacterium RIFCSPHIGHO2_01_FULL_54_22]|nr:MAG: hypothetical protein A2789_02300 [Candidatus Peribacteria bacterium RIFCSPHIGHO2_01_FULL_54_22]OGJ62648.1 MAG: hypothetical protein A3D12_03730 [Candidatus Peribacteria bacterium RIFCSPHIGHO2_02_FULL_55_24]
MSACDVHVGEHAESEEVGGVLRESDVPGLHHVEPVLDDVVGVLDEGTHTRLLLLVLPALRRFNNGGVFQCAFLHE